MDFKSRNRANIYHGELFGYEALGIFWVYCRRTQQVLKQKLVVGVVSPVYFITSNIITNDQSFSLQFQCNPFNVYQCSL